MGSAIPYQRNKFLFYGGKQEGTTEIAKLPSNSQLFFR